MEIQKEEFSPSTRNREILDIDNTEVNAVIIGGGITGAGVANILAQNSINPVLLEMNDFGSGTSSGSSKLIHGGLRYLAQGHFRLTKQLLAERNYLVKNTDFIHMLDFDILVDKYSWGKSKIRLGLFMYGLLGGGKKFPRFVRNSGKYNRSVTGYFTYNDAFGIDSVLVIHNVISAHMLGAHCLNYCKVKDIMEDRDQYTIKFVDKQNSKEHVLKTKYVINCGGPWANQISSKLGIPEDNFRLSRGIHLIFKREDLPVDNCVVFRSHIDGRQMFLIPYEGVTIAGTTDSFVDSPDDFSIAEEDKDYIVKSTARLFPSINDRKIVSSYAGIRPLFGKGDTPGEVSRDFFVKSHNGFISVYGGKLTDYRNVARKVAVQFSRVSGIKIRTKGLPEIIYRRPKVIADPSYFIRHECAITPEDILRRRTAVSILDPDQAKNLKTSISEYFGDNALKS